MLALPELQHRLARALLGREPLQSGWFVEDGIPAELRLAVHCNNMFVSLKKALRATFPAVCRVVDERFFLYATEEFIKHRPPRQTHLSAYGAEFPDFLRDFPPCRGLPYLSDLARLEWLIHRAAHADSPPPLTANVFRGVQQLQLLQLRLTLSPSFSFLRSPWPIDRIFRANTGNAEGMPIDLDSGAVSLEIRRIDGATALRGLPAGIFTFRASLHSGCTLEIAAGLGRSADACFDLSRALVELFQEQALVGFSLPCTAWGQPA